MGKRRRNTQIKENGRRKRKGEDAKRTERSQKRRESIPVRDDGAGARDISTPGRHHRKGSNGS